MATAPDAELILKLYDLRREDRMRSARNWVIHEFQPRTLDDLLDVMRDFGSEHNQYWRQVIGYWEMAAALVLRGALDGDLFVDANGEYLFLLAKFGRLNAEYEASAGNGFMPHVAELVERYPTAKARYLRIRDYLDSPQSS